MYFDIFNFMVSKFAKFRYEIMKIKQNNYNSWKESKKSEKY